METELDQTVEEENNNVVVIDVGDDEEAKEEETEEEQSETEETESDETESEDEDDEEDVVAIEGETPPDQEEQETQRAPEWVREVRKKNRSLNDEVKQLKAELERAKTVQPEALTLPNKPKLEDFDYDSEEYENALESWHEKKREHDEQKRKLASQEEENNKQAQKVMENYTESKKNLKVKDYDVIEDIVVDKLPVELQNVILATADNPATLVYAIGKNKAKLEELAKIDNPLLFAKEIGKIEGKLKVERKKRPPEPEKVVKGSANSVSSDATLDKLREEAIKTGDMSKVMAYKRQMKK